MPIDPSLSPELLALLVVTTFLAYLISGVLGIGGPLVLVPVLLTVLPPAQAVAMTAPVMLAHGGAKLFVFAREIDRTAAIWLVASAVPATAIASRFTHVVDGTVLELGLGLVILTTVILPRVRNTDPDPNRPPSSLVPWGLAAGAVAGLAGTAGPLTAVAIRNRGLVGARFVGTLAVMQFSLQVVRVPIYVGTGALPATLATLAVALGLASTASVFAARPLLRKVDPAHYRRWLDALLVVIALVLLGRGITSLLGAA